jgi:hypothetical protein
LRNSAGLFPRCGDTQPYAVEREAEDLTITRHYVAPEAIVPELLEFLITA